MSTEAKTLESRTQYRDYPEQLKATVINAIERNGGNVLATARLFNLPRDTVNYWWYHSDRFVEIKHASGQNLADKLENLAHSAADSMAEHDLNIVSFADKARAMGIVIDKMQLLRGQPTTINANLDVKEVSIVLSSSLADFEQTDTPADVDRLALNPQSVDP